MFSSTKERISYILWEISFILKDILCLGWFIVDRYKDVTSSFLIRHQFSVLAFVLLNVYLFFQQQRQLNHMRRNSVAARPTTKLNDSLVKRSATKLKDKTFNMKERRLAFINIGLVAKFVLSWLPTLGKMNYHLIWEDSVVASVEYLSYHLVLGNCLCDPTVYVCLSHDIRKSVQTMFRRRKKFSSDSRFATSDAQDNLRTVQEGRQRKRGIVGAPPPLTPYVTNFDVTYI